MKEPNYGFIEFGIVDTGSGNVESGYLHAMSIVVILPASRNRSTLGLANGLQVIVNDRPSKVMRMIKDSYE